MRAEAGRDRAARALALAVRGLPAERADWGDAMSAELAGVRGARARWSFSLGCARTAVGMRMRAAVLAHDRGGAGLRASVLAAIAASIVLALYGPVRYPGLRTGDSWFALLAFLAIVLAYGVAALSLSRGRAPAAATARRCGVAGGLAVGGGWLLIFLPVSKAFFFVPLAVALVAPIVVAALAGHLSHDAGVGRAAALWSGLVGGLLVFIAYVTVTYAGDGRPYDAQTLRDFHASGARDLVTYAVADDLGGALSMLVIIPVVALALGSLTSARASATRLAPPRR
jgi:hypothetical protein